MKIIYDEITLNKAIDFVWENNKSFSSGAREVVEEFVTNLIRETVLNKEIYWTSSGGFMIVFMRDEEDDSVIDIDISVDPALMESDFKMVTVDI